MQETVCPAAVQPWGWLALASARGAIVPGVGLASLRHWSGAQPAGYTHTPTLLCVGMQPRARHPHGQDAAWLGSAGSVSRHCKEWGQGTALPAAAVHIHVALLLQHRVAW